MTKILITDYAWENLDIERRVLAPSGAEIVVAETGSEEEVIALAADVDAILTCWAPVTSAVLEAAPRCRTVARYGVGLDNIDVGRATELGIVVTNVPDYCLDEVSDHAAALILAQMRHIVPFARQTAGGAWDNRAFGPMRRVRGSTLGLVGFGAIARRLAAKMQGFGMRVLAFSPELAPGSIVDGVEAVGTLHDLMSASDVISVHVPLTPETRGLIGADELAVMRSSAYLVNTSRGPVVDPVALVAALEARQLAGAALDVLTVEPPEAGNHLVGRTDVILTPHAAFDSHESVEELQFKAATNVLDVLEGRIPTYIVNREALDSNARASA